MANRYEKEGRTPIVLAPFNPIGSHGSQTVNSSAVFSPEIPDDADLVLVQALTQNIRFTLDGTNPTTSSGFQITAGSDVLVIPIGADSEIKFIAESNGAKLEYQFGE